MSHFFHSLEVDVLVVVGWVWSSNITIILIISALGMKDTTSSRGPQARPPYATCLPGI